MQRVKSAHRLVKNQQLWLVSHGNNKLDFLRHALRQLSGPLVPPLLSAEPVKPVAHSGFGIGFRRSVHPRKKHQLPPYGLVVKQAPLLGQVAYRRTATNAAFLLLRSCRNK